MRVPVRAEVVELGAGLPGEHAEVARVDADRAEPRPGDLDGSCDALADVVGVDEQRGAGAERVDLARERVGSSSCSSVKACALVPAVGMP